MKRSTGYWSTALAAAALIALPASGFAQPPADPQSPQPTTQTPTSQGTASQSATSPTSDTATSPADHVREAKQALSSIPQGSIPARDRAQFAQLRTHLNNLERDVASGASSSSASASASSTRAGRRGSRAASATTHNWASEVSAIDTILSKLIGSDDTRGNSAPAGEATGTAGSQPSASATAGTSGRAGASASSIDESTKDKLREVRRHVTELASSMSGTTGASRTDTTGAASGASSPDAMGSASSSSQAAAPTTPTSGSTSATQSSSSTPSAESSQAAQPTPQVDAAAAKQHLSEARDSLSQLTTLPEAAKLQGEARTQVSQLISNFNELITTQANWREAYDKVEANVNALLGPDASAAMPSATAGTTGTAPTAPTGTTGTAGTAGSTAGTTGTATAAAPGSIQIDPAIRAKLVEFRTHLSEFEKAAGGSAQPSASSATGASSNVNTSPSANPATPMSTTASSTASGSMPPSTATSSTSNPANPTASASSSNPANPTASATGSAAASSAVGTSGSAAAAPTATDTSAQGAKASEQAGHAQADKELDAIQAILDKAKNGRLDKSDTEQLKAHVAQLRQLLSQSGSSK